MERWLIVISAAVWYKALFQKNKVSKIVQSPKVSFKIQREEIRAVTEFLQEFLDNGFHSETDAREITEILELEISWSEVHLRRGRQFNMKKQIKLCQLQKLNKNSFYSLLKIQPLSHKMRDFHT